MFSCEEATPELQVVFPLDTWQERTPEALNVDTQKLQEALDYLASESGKDSLHEVFIARKGFVIYKGDSIHKKHNLYSATKTFPSTVLGLLMDFDLVHDYTNAKTIDPEMERFYPTLKLKHFANMTSGYTTKSQNSELHGTENCAASPYEIDTSLVAPGQRFEYSDEAQMMFGRLLTKRVKKTMKEVFDKNIGSLIGLGEYEWLTAGSVDSIAINNAASGVLITAEQLARFGHLYLNEGHWNGKQILSRYWINRATSNQVNSVEFDTLTGKNSDGRGCYGFNWWVNGVLPNGQYHMPDAPKSLYYASGSHNNVCFVIPEWDMVFVRRGEDAHLKKGQAFVYNEFFKRMTLAIKEY